MRRASPLLPCITETIGKQMARPRTKRNRIKGEELLKFRCNRCGNCCRLHIPVTDADVRRLVDALGLPAHRIVQFFEPSEFGTSPGPLAWVRFGPERHDRKAMCLREAWDKCLFLKSNRCIAYEHRPIVCREHPFDLTLDDSERRIELVELNEPCTCKHTLDGRVSKREIKKIHRQSLKQDEGYYAKVRRWNRSVRCDNSSTERGFLKFLGLL